MALPCVAVFLRRASRRLLASSLDDQSCEDSGTGCGTAAPAAVTAVVPELVVAKRGSGFSFAGDGGGSVDGDDGAAAGCCFSGFQVAAAPVESWFRGAAAVLAETSGLDETSEKLMIYSQQNAEHYRTITSTKIEKNNQAHDTP